MAVTLKRLVSGSQLTGAAAAYYTAPALTKAVIKSAVICNTTGGSINVTVHLVPSGGTADATNRVISARAVAAGATDLCPELLNQVLEAGGSLQALGANLTLVASGVEIA